MKQVIDTNIELVQNWEEGLDKRISAISAYEVGTEKFRAPVQVDQGGQVGGFNPDGGSLLEGTGAEYLQFTITVLNEFDNAVMGVTRERNRIQELERMGPAGKQLREDNAARLRNTYLEPIIRKHIKAIQDGIRGSQEAEQARRKEIGKVARVEPQSAATAGPQPNLTEAQVQEKALALVQQDPRWKAADADEKQILLMNARVSVKYGN